MSVMPSRQRKGAGSDLMLRAAIVVAMRQDLFDTDFDELLRRRALFMVAWPTRAFLASPVFIAFSPVAAMPCRMLAALGGLAGSRGSFGAPASAAGPAIAG